MVKGIVEPQDIEDADEDAGSRKIRAWVDPDVTDSPVGFLGFHGPKVVFAMPEGEIREELAAKITQLLKVDIYNSEGGQAFLSNWVDGENKFMRDSAAIWFVRQCRRAGRWDTSRAVRGLGVWPEPGGRVVLHRGPEIWEYVPGSPPEQTPVAKTLQRRQGPLYGLKAAMPAPDLPASSDYGQWVRQQLDLWRFEAIGEDGLTGADVVAGWLMASLLGGVAPFRPHCLIFALAGSGKTTLMEFVQAVLSALASDVIDSWTGPGLRQELAGTARPVLLDEAETSVSSIPGKGPVDEALETLRRMSTGDGGVRKQGDSTGGSGGPVTQTAVGMGMLAAVTPPKLGAADTSRFVEVRLLSLVEPKPLSGVPPDPLRRVLSTDRQLATVIDRARTMAPALLGRALAGAARYPADVDLIKAQVLAAHGNVRTADLVAALAAGLRLLTDETPLDEARAAELAGEWRGLVEVRAHDEGAQNPALDALAHLFAWPTGIHNHDRVLSVGEIIKRWRNRRRRPEELPASGEETLRHMGLILREVEDKDAGDWTPWVAIANNHPTLTRIFERTAWVDHRRVLGYLTGIGPEWKTEVADKMRYGLNQQRGLWIPLSPLLGRWDEDASQ